MSPAPTQSRCHGCGQQLPDSAAGACPYCGYRLGLRPAGAGPAQAQPAARPLPTFSAEFSAKIEVLGLLGEGGMGVVYKARLRKSFLTVAVKFGREMLGPSGRQRFLRENLLASKMDHPNIVKCLDSGEENGFPYIVFEFVDGISLRDRIVSGRRLGFRQCANYLMQLASALEHAHALGVIHRDIKSENLLITKDGTLKVADFGLAKHYGFEEGKTVAGTVMGTPGFMSPEQAGGKAVNHQSDLYSAGAVGYEMLTGKPPFEGNGLQEILTRHVAGIYRPPSELNPATPKRLEEILAKVMAVQPVDRHPTAADLRLDLQRFLEQHYGADSGSEESEALELPAVEHPESGPPSLSTPPRSTRRRREQAGASLELPQVADGPQVLPGPARPGTGLPALLRVWTLALVSAAIGLGWLLARAPAPAPPTTGARQADPIAARKALALGLEEAAAGKVDAASQHFIRALQADSLDPELYRSIAQAFRDPDKARAWLEEFVATAAADNPVAHLALAEVLVDAGDLESARLHWAHAQSLLPDDGGQPELTKAFEHLNQALGASSSPAATAGPNGKPK